MTTPIAQSVPSPNALHHRDSTQADKPNNTCSVSGNRHHVSIHPRSTAAARTVDGSRYQSNSIRWTIYIVLLRRHTPHHRRDSRACHSLHLPAQPDGTLLAISTHMVATNRSENGIRQAPAALDLELATLVRRALGTVDAGGRFGQRKVFIAA